MTGFGGAGTSPIAGGDAFMIVEVGHAIFLRPSAGFGAGVQGAASYWGAGRFDGCCACPATTSSGAGCSSTRASAPRSPASPRGFRAARPTCAGCSPPGPSVALRGELASALSVEVRAVSGFNVLLSGPSVDVLSLRAELGFTWRLR